MSRIDFSIITNWVNEGSHIMDLACGDGALLAHLMKWKHVTGYGLEIDAKNVQHCIDNGVNVIEQNIDKGLNQFSHQMFDTVIMTQALQVLTYPHTALDEMLRVGKECIVTFPNFGHWRCRTYLVLHGMMPVSKFLPYNWYDTPNIHFCTIRDFETLCNQKKWVIIDRIVVDRAHRGGMKTRFFPNLMGEMAIYRLTK